MLRRSPNFAVILRSGDKRNLLGKLDIEALIKCKAEPESVEVRPSNLIVASLFYRLWDEAVVCLRALRLDRVHNLLPVLSPKVSVEERLFSDRIKRLIDGEVKKRTSSNWLSSGLES